MRVPPFSDKTEMLETVVHLLCEKLCTISVGGGRIQFYCKLLLIPKMSRMGRGARTPIDKAGISLLRFEDLCIIKILTAAVLSFFAIGCRNASPLPTVNNNRIT